MDNELMSTGQVARELGVSTSLLRLLEKTGVTPRAQRIAGLDRRAYSAGEVETIRQIIEQRRASQQSRNRPESRVA